MRAAAAAVLCVRLSIFRYIQGALRAGGGDDGATAAAALAWLIF